MPATTIATGTFPSRRAADQAVQRLVSGGFARNSIGLHRHEEDEGYDLEVHTRQENLKRVQRLMHESASMHSVRQATSGVVSQAKSHPAILLGAGLLAGFIIYNLIPRASTSSPKSKRSSHSGNKGRRPQR